MGWRLELRHRAICRLRGPPVPSEEAKLLIGRNADGEVVFPNIKWDKLAPSSVTTAAAFCRRDHGGNL